MAGSKTRPRKTVEDYMKLPEGARAELIEGEIFTSPSPKERHQRIAFNIAFALRKFVEARSLGRIYVAPFDVHLSSGDVVEPDVIFVSTANLGIIRDWIRGVPDFLIEVVSPDSPERDLIVKRDLYAQNGVPEYWIVEPEKKSVEVLTLSGASYAPLGWFEEGDTIRSKALASLTLPAREVFA